MAKKNSREGIMQEIEMPAGVSASVSGTVLTVKGQKGEVSRQLNDKNVAVAAEGSRIRIQSKRSTKKDRKAIGSLAAHINNMARGSSSPHIYILKICSGHFPMNVSVQSGKFTIKNLLGEKVPRVIIIKHGADVKVEGELVYVTSPSKEIAGQVSADIEQFTRRPGFDTRVFQDGIYIISKDGKALK